MLTELMEIMVAATGTAVVVVPAYFMSKGGGKLKNELEDTKAQLATARATLKGLDDLMLKERDVWYGMGKKHALDEVARLRSEEGLTFRVAAHKINKSCAECGRTCLHCAKEDKG